MNRCTTALVLAASLAASIAASCGGSSGGGSSALPAVPAVDATAPSVTITEPAPGVPLTGTVRLAADVTDAGGLARVEFLVDGATVGNALSSPPFEIDWDSTSATDGLHVLAVVAEDLSGNRSVTAARPLDVINMPLVLDQLEFATFLGGSEKDSLRDVTVDLQGNVYVTGGTESPTFPVTAGALDDTFNGVHDVFVTKFAPDGTLVWSTLVGGPGYDRAYAIEVDEAGAVYVTGRAGPGFPTTSGSLQPNFGGDLIPSAQYGEQDGFVAKLTPDGSGLEWATYFGGEDGSNIRDLAVDWLGAVHIAADAGFNFPNPHVPADALQPEIVGQRDALVAKLAPDGASLEWATYLGGSDGDGGAGSIRLDPSGGVVYLGHTSSLDLPVTAQAFQTQLGGGKDLFVARFHPDGGSLLYVTYFGGSGSEFTETHGLSVDGEGVVYVTATTTSEDLIFPPASIADPYQRTYGGSGAKGTGLKTNYPGDGFIAKLARDGSRLLAFTYFGGTLGEGIEGSAVDRFGNVFVSGATYSSDLPLAGAAFQPNARGFTDAFVASFSANLSHLRYATYLGGTEHDFGRAMAVTPKGGIIGAGVTFSADLSTTVGAFDSVYDGVSDGLLFKIN